MSPRPVSIYFDSSLFIPVFESGTFFDNLRSAAAEKRLQTIVSDIDLAEASSGTALGSFRKGIERVVSLRPLWTVLAGLGARELLFEHARFLGRPAGGPLLAVTTWNEFLPAITSPEELSEAGVTAGTAVPDALTALYPPESIAERLKYWQEQLTALGGDITDMLQYVKTARNVFFKIVAHTIRRNFKDSEELVSQLWAHPNRAPAFRLNIEITIEKLTSQSTNWTTNDFLDLAHAAALPYVDIFATNDTRFKKKIKRYDERVMHPAQLPGYSARLCSSWEEIERRL